ncbi:MAG: peptidylprolyl isomerase [Alphaproteobacteria bacterium]
MVVAIMKNFGKRLCLPLLALGLGLGGVALGALVPAPAQAMEERIIAVVNEEVISLSDLNNRMRLATLASGLPANRETYDRLRPNVLRSLIEERLQLQDAISQGVTVSPEQLDAGLAELARQNNLTAEQLVNQLESRGVARRTLMDQVRAQIAWNGVINSAVARQAVVTEDEVDLMLERIAANAGEPELRVAEILLPVNRPGDDPQARALADRLVQELKNGASFPRIARQFSGAVGARNGGDLGYVTLSQFDPDVQRILRDAPKGQLVGPVRTLAGWQIFAVIDRRTIMEGAGSNDKLTLSQLVVPLGDAEDLSSLTAQREAADALLEEVKSSVAEQDANQCDTLQSMGDGVKSDMSGELGTVTLSDLPASLQARVSDLPVGQPSSLVRSPDGWLILMVCDRTEGEVKLPPRDQVRDVLSRQKMDMLARRRLRDLQAEAFIETRN